MFLKSSEFKVFLTLSSLTLPNPTPSHMGVPGSGSSYTKFGGHFGFLRCRFGVFLTGAEIPCIGAEAPRLMPH